MKNKSVKFKFLHMFYVVFVMGFFALFLVGCGKNSIDNIITTIDKVTTTTNDEIDIIDPENIDITGVYLNDLEVVYDGNIHSIEVEGDIPTDVTVLYFNNGKKDSGTYTVKAILEGDGYNTLRLTATLTIKDAEFDTIEFSDEVVNFDTKYHKLRISGTWPDGTTIEDDSTTWPDGAQVIYSQERGVVLPGTYTIAAQVSYPNYETKIYTAKITVNKVDYDNIENIKFEYDYYDNDYLGYIGRSLDNIVTLNDLPSIELDVDGYLVTYHFNVTYKYKDSDGNILNYMIDAGEYTVIAYVNSVLYNEFTVETKAYVKKANIETSSLGFYYKEEEFNYDIHETTIIGDIPYGVNVEYKTFYLDDYLLNGDAATSIDAVNVGDYIVKAYMSGKNYNDCSMEVELKIVEKEFDEDDLTKIMSYLDINDSNFDITFSDEDDTIISSIEELISYIELIPNINDILDSDATLIYKCYDYYQKLDSDSKSSVDNYNKLIKSVNRLESIGYKRTVSSIKYKVTYDTKVHNSVTVSYFNDILLEFDMVSAPSDYYNNLVYFKDYMTYDNCYIRFSGSNYSYDNLNDIDFEFELIKAELLDFISLSSLEGNVNEYSISYTDNLGLLSILEELFNINYTAILDGVVDNKFSTTGSYEVLVYITDKTSLTDTDTSLTINFSETSFIVCVTII